MPICGNNYSAIGNYVIVADTGSRPVGADRYPGGRIFQLDNGTEYLWDGTGWVIMSEPARSHTPTVSNFTIGTGGLAAAVGFYKRSDGWCDYSAYLTLGTTGWAIGTGFTTNLPFSAHHLRAGQLQVVAVDTGNTWFPLVNSATGAPGFTTSLFVHLASGTYVSGISPSPTVPFTWVPGDSLEMSCRYRMASRYS